MTRNEGVKTVQQAIYQAARALEAEGLAYTMRDARRLMTAALGIESDRLTLHLRDMISPETQEVFDGYCKRRADREPVSRILGGRLFYGRWFKNGPEVLDPRPETETLIECALSEPFGDFLDIGTGSGCIALTLLAERLGVTALATDLSAKALSIAEQNANALGVRERVRFLESNWFEKIEGRFDLIVSNPPYIHPSEMNELDAEVVNNDPHIALTDFADGLTGYRQIARHARSHLTRAGRVLVEIGPTQASDVIELFVSAGFEDCKSHPDMDGRDRVVEARAPVS